MVHFLGVPLVERIVLHTLKWRNLQKKIVTSPFWPAYKYSMEWRKEVHQLNAAKRANPQILCLIVKPRMQSHILCVFLIA
jgi:hypothetical protein